MHKLDSKFTMRSSGLIYKILEEYPQHIVSIRYRLIEMQMLPDLITRLTALHCDDTVRKGIRDYFVLNRLLGGVLKYCIFWKTNVVLVSACH